MNKAHHSSKAQYALNDFVAFDNAIGQALKQTNEQNKNSSTIQRNWCFYL